MAKKRPAPRRRVARNSAPDAAAPPEVAEAAAAVQRARDALRRAEDAYQQVCEDAAEQLTKAGKMTMGEAIDGGLEFVRRHPISGLCAAGILGYLAGRILRR